MNRRDRKGCNAIAGLFLRALRFLALLALQLFSPTLINPKIAEADPFLMGGPLLLQGLKR